MLGFWHRDTKAAFVALTNSRFPFFRIAVHELTHGWIYSITRTSFLPYVISESFPRAVDRMFGYAPVNCELARWKDPAKNLSCVWGDFPFFTIRNLLALQTNDVSKLGPRASLTLDWEIDAFLAFWFSRIVHPAGPNGILNRIQVCNRTSDAHLKWIADSCDMPVDELEKEFKEHVRLGSWTPVVPLRKSGNAEEKPSVIT